MTYSNANEILNVNKVFTPVCRVLSVVCTGITLELNYLNAPFPGILQHTISCKARLQKTKRQPHIYRCWSYN